MLLLVEVILFSKDEFNIDGNLLTFSFRDLDLIPFTSGDIFLKVNCLASFGVN